MKTVLMGCVCFCISNYIRIWMLQGRIRALEKQLEEQTK